MHHPSIWTNDSLPLCYVVEGSDNFMYIVPAIHGGWSQRRPYRGYKTALKPVLAGAQLIAADLGAA